MDKQQVISLIKEKLTTGMISKDDILNLLNINTQSNLSPPEDEPAHQSKNLISTFYAIGAIIALAGVGVLIAQNWEDIGFLGRILVTLGISLVTYIFAFILKNPEQRTLSQIFFTISAALAPLGSFVLLREANINITLNAQASVALVLFVVFGSAFLISRKNILFLIIIAFASWTYYAFLLKIFDFNLLENLDVLKWASMLAGASYIFISYGYKKISVPLDNSDEKEKKAINGILYTFGSLTILTAGIFIGGTFDLFYILLIFAAFYGSVYLKSRSMLSLGALFLMAHIIKLTSRYFVDSIGWPLALIVIGFLVIGVGYMTYSLNRRFISVAK